MPWAALGAAAGAYLSGRSNDGGTSNRTKTMEGLQFWQNYNQQAEQHALAKNTQYLSNWLAQDQYLNNVQRKVQDAKNAGIHPLYALGQGASYGNLNAVFPGSNPLPTSSGQSSTGSAAGDALSGIGQAISTFQAKKIAKAQRVQQTALNAQTLAESRARTRFTNSRADAIDIQNRASIAKRGQLRSNTKQDQSLGNLSSPYGDLPELPVEAQAETWEKHYGGATSEAVGFTTMLNETGKKLGKKLYKKHRAYNRQFTDPYIGGP